MHLRAVEIDGGGYGRFQRYPEFRGIENHIRQQIWRSMREEMTEPDDGRDLMNQLQQIRYQAQREFQAHGWRLPDDDRERIHQPQPYPTLAESRTPD